MQKQEWADEDLTADGVTPYPHMPLFHPELDFDLQCAVKVANRHGEPIAWHMNQCYASKVAMQNQITKEADSKPDEEIGGYSPEERAVQAEEVLDAQLQKANELRIQEEADENRNRIERAELPVTQGK